MIADNPLGHQHPVGQPHPIVIGDVYGLECRRLAPQGGHRMGPAVIDHCITQHRTAQLFQDMDQGIPVLAGQGCNQGLGCQGGFHAQLVVQQQGAVLANQPHAVKGHQPQGQDLDQQHPNQQAYRQTHLGHGIRSLGAV